MARSRRSRSRPGSCRRSALSQRRDSRRERRASHSGGQGKRSRRRDRRAGGRRAGAESEKPSGRPPSPLAGRDRSPHRVALAAEAAALESAARRRACHRGHRLMRWPPTEPAALGHDDGQDGQDQDEGGQARPSRPRPDQDGQRRSNGRAPSTADADASRDHRPASPRRRSAGRRRRLTVIENLLNAFRAPDLRRRLLFVAGILVVFRFLAHVPVPGADPSRARSSSSTATRCSACSTCSRAAGCRGSRSSGSG